MEDDGSYDAGNCQLHPRCDGCREEKKLTALRRRAEGAPGGLTDIALWEQGELSDEWLDEHVGDLCDRIGGVTCVNIRDWLRAVIAADRKEG